MRLTTKRLLTLALMAGISTAACDKSSTPKDAPATGTAPAAAGNGTGPVAKVNGVDIGRDAFGRQMERTRQRFTQAKREIPPALEVRLKENIVRKLVDDELIAQRAKAEGVSLTDAEVDARLQEHKTRFGSPEAFTGFLERTGQTEADLKDELMRTELRDRLFKKLAAVEDPTDAEVKDFYEKSLDRYKDREQVNALQVMWKSDKNDPPADRKKIEARAKAAAAELKKKGTDFKAKIATYKDAQPAPNGGDLGWIMRGRQVKQIEDGIFDPKVKAGDVVGPIETQFGFHILKVTERKAERQKPLDEVSAGIKTAITARKRSEKTREVLQNLKKDAKVEVLEPGVSLEAKPLPGIPQVGPDGKPMAPVMVQPAGPAGAPIQVQPVQPAPGTEPAQPQH